MRRLSEELTKRIKDRDIRFSNEGKDFKGDTDFLNLGTTSPKPIVFHIEIENQPANFPQNNFANEIQKGYSYYRETLLTRN